MIDMKALFTGKKIIIIGLGLIGGSLARALVAAGCDCEIVGVGRDVKVLQQAIEDGSITSFTTDVQTACAEADLVVVAVPVLSVKAMLQEIKSVIAPHTVITDVASVKQAVIDAVREVLGSVPANFVPGHPIAGSEQSGYKAAKAELFQDRKVILTPLDNTAPDAVALVQALWQLTGAEVLQMSVPHHDDVLAATSHLPHLLAFALVDTLSQQGEKQDIFRYAAGGFRDFTRIASSDPVMWRDIFVTNGPATVKVLDDYVKDLQRLRGALVQGDGKLLLDTFKRANDSRNIFLSFSSKKSGKPHE